MPLITPSTATTTSNPNTETWNAQLIGKKLGDSDSTSTFAKTSLPKDHRVLREGDMSTMDHKPERLNIHTAADGTVVKCTHG